jgi:hypothetical protein
MLQETKEEIYDSKQAIYEAYSHPTNYEKLLRGETGDNVFRKYLTRVLVDAFPSSLDLIFEILLQLIEERGSLTDSHRQFLDAVREWMLVSRDFSNVLRDANVSEDVTYEEFEFDIDQWYRDLNFKPIEQYRRIIKPGFYYERDALKNLLSQYSELYGNDIYYCLGQLLNFYSPDVLWKKYVL